MIGFFSATTGVLVIIAITLFTVKHDFLADINYRKFATRGYIINPPNTVFVIALPCETWSQLYLCCLLLIRSKSGKILFLI